MVLSPVGLTILGSLAPERVSRSVLALPVRLPYQTTMSIANQAAKVALGIHQLANADIVVNSATYPCHHNQFDMEFVAYDIGHGKKKRFNVVIIIPTYDTKGVAWLLDAKIEEGDRFEVRSRYRKALSHKVRVDTIEADECSLTLHCTDVNR